MIKNLKKVVASHDAKSWFQIEETSPGQMGKHGIYISIMMRNGEIISVYIGSSIVKNEVITNRFKNCGKVKSKGHRTSEDAKCKHLKIALHSGDGWHVRRLIVLDQSEVSTLKMMALEGLLIDLIGSPASGIIKEL